MTRNHLFFRLFLYLFLMSAPLMTLQAQTISPWFRGGKQVWEALLKKAVIPVNGKAVLTTPLSHAVTGFSVKTNAYNWLLHRMNYSGVFSRMEKDILLQKTTTEKATLGKLAYFHDRDALLFNALSTQPGANADESAFWRHQNTLTNTLAELEDFYQDILPSRFTNTLFSPEDIKSLLADPIQPPAFVLSVREISQFAALNTLEQQRSWTDQMLHQTNADLNSLLAKQPTALKGFEFERYYIQKLRLDYFKTLQEVLSKSTDKRRSLIIRRKRVLKIELPGAQQPMTDAQRLGFLRYHLDKLTAQNMDITLPKNSNLQKYLEIKALLGRLAPIYETYATAEAFAVPYEDVLRQGTLWPDIIVGKQTGLNLHQLLGKKPLKPLLAPRIFQLEQQLQAMRNQQPDGLDFYIRYYRLDREKALYNTFLIRERLF